MKRTRSFLIGTLAIAGCTMTPPEIAVINDAASALGGRDRILAVNTLVIEGTGENGNLGQNRTPEAPGPIYQVSEFTRSFDFANSRARLEQVRTPKFVFINMMPVKQIQAVDGNIAFNVAADGAATRASDMVAKDRGAELLHHPIGALRAALAEGARVTNPRKDGTADVVDITSAQGDTLTLSIDSATKLPAKVATRAYNAVLGDVTITTSFDNYADVDGLKLPGRLTTTVDNYTAADIRVSKSTVNGDVANLGAPDNVKSAPAPTPTANVTVEEISKGIWLLGGQSHHSVLVEFADHLTLIEAPLNEQRTSAVLAKVKEIRPDKPLKYVVITHHHFDHSGGVRRAIAEGATLVVHASSKAFYEELAQRKHTIVPDELSRNPKPLTIETVSDTHVMKDATRTIEVHTVPGNPHGETLLMVYFPAERLLVQGDLYNPAVAPNSPPVPWVFAPNFLENVQKLKLRVDRIVPIHGRIVPFSELVAAVKLS